MNLKALARLIESRLNRSAAVEIDGLGVFARGSNGEISFTGTGRARVFIAYASEDGLLADRLYKAFTDHGFSAWLDRYKLLPGQNWPRRIQDAIASCDFFIACFSSHSVTKRGGFQAELRHALDCASRIPLDDVFLIPVRFDECRVPARIHCETQYVDLFPDWETGFTRILSIVDRQNKRAA